MDYIIFCSLASRLAQFSWVELSSFDVEFSNCEAPFTFCIRSRVNATVDVISNRLNCCVLSKIPSKASRVFNRQKFCYIILKQAIVERTFSIVWKSHMSVIKWVERLGYPPPASD